MTTIKAIAVWYFDFGWILSSILAFFLGTIAVKSKHNRRNVMLLLSCYIVIPYFLLYAKYNF